MRTTAGSSRSSLGPPLSPSLVVFHISSLHPFVRLCLPRLARSLHPQTPARPSTPRVSDNFCGLRGLDSLLPCLSHRPRLFLTNHSVINRQWITTYRFIGTESPEFDVSVKDTRFLSDYQTGPPRPNLRRCLTYTGDLSYTTFVLGVTLSRPSPDDSPLI